MPCRSDDHGATVLLLQKYRQCRQRGGDARSKDPCRPALQAQQALARMQHQWGGLRPRVRVPRCGGGYDDSLCTDQYGQGCAGLQKCTRRYTSHTSNQIPVQSILRFSSRRIDHRAPNQHPHVSDDHPGRMATISLPHELGPSTVVSRRIWRSASPGTRYISICLSSGCAYRFVLDCKQERFEERHHIQMSC